MQALVVEDQSLMLDMLKGILKDTRCFQSVLTATDGAESLKIIRKHSPDFLLLDIEIPRLSGLRVAQLVRESDQSMKIVIMTSHLNEVTICGIHRIPQLSGCILKNESFRRDVKRMIPLVLQGSTFFSKAYFDLLHQFLSSNHSLEKLVNPKDRRFLGLIGVGWSDEEISAYLKVSVNTVTWRIKQLRNRLNLHSRCQLMLFAQQRGLAKVSWRGMGLVDRFDVL